MFEEMLPNDSELPMRPPGVEETKPVRLNVAGRKHLLEFFSNITSRPSKEQIEELTVQVAMLGSDDYSKDRLDKWFTKRRYKEKAKTRQSLKDLSNVANASDTPAAPMEETLPNDSPAIEETKSVKLNVAGSKHLLAFFSNIASRPSKQQMEELTVQVAALGNDDYSKDRLDKWFATRRYKEKAKTRKSLKDLSNVANASTSDTPAAPTPPPPPIPAPKTKRPRKKRVPKPIDISHHATLAALCAEVSYQSAQNLARTWAGILKCDQELLNAWIDDYYGASVSSTEIPILAPEPEQVLQDPEPMQVIDADTTLIDEPIHSIDEPKQLINDPLLARIPPPPLNICPYKGSIHLPLATSPYYRTMFAWGTSYKSPKPPHEDLFREITKKMDAADMDMNWQRTSMSLDEFNARMEPVLGRVKDFLGRLGRGEATCLN